MKKISFVIPCYSSENTVSQVVLEIHQLMDRHKSFGYEIILVNDCSPDRVWEVIKKLCAEKPEIVRGISLAKNFGQHSALMAGYHYCRGDYIVTLDDDGQTPADQSFCLLDRLFAGCDVVYGRYAERKDSLFRKMGTAMNNFMLHALLGKPKSLHLTSFFAAKSYVIHEICRYKNAFPYIWGLILRTTHNIENVTIQQRNRIYGQSGYTVKKLLGLWLDGFTAFSIKPLRAASGLGFLFACAGMAGVLYTVGRKLVHPQIAAGYSSLMSVLLMIGGILMILLGLIGEYVGRIYLCINTMPQYVVREVLDDGREV